MERAEKIEIIKRWLGTGTINVFGLPMSGKDTVGIRLAEDLDAKFLSSGMMIRAVEKEAGEDLTGSGKLVPTDLFYNVVLPYFGRANLRGYPLVLSSVGRWSGEETEVMRRLEATGHETMAVIWLQISEEEAITRWEAVQTLSDRGGREDDKDLNVFKVRLAEFKEKTMPVLQKYKDLNLAVPIVANTEREAVYDAVINALYNFINT